MWRHACVVSLCLLAACGEAQDRPGAAAAVKAALPAADQVPKKFPLIKKMLEGKLPSLKMPSLKRAELDAKLTSTLAKRHFGLRDLAEKATGALAGAGAVRSLRTGLLALNRSHVMHLLADAKMACVAEHAALCFKGASDDARRVAAWAKASSPTTSDGEPLPEQAGRVRVRVKAVRVKAVRVKAVRVKAVRVKAVRVKAVRVRARVRATARSP